MMMQFLLEKEILLLCQADNFFTSQKNSSRNVLVQIDRYLYNGMATLNVAIVKYILNDRYDFKEEKLFRKLKKLI